MTLGESRNGSPVEKPFYGLSGPQLRIQGLFQRGFFSRLQRVPGTGFPPLLSPRLLQRPGFLWLSADFSLPCS